MPVTRGAGNPKWTWDETLLALDMLYRKGAISKDHSDVLELSALLRSVDLVPRSKRRESFRNADGVALKLQNLLSAIEPTRGLSASKTDRLAVLTFPRIRANELEVIANSIRATLSAGVEQLAPTDEEQEVFIEGRILSGLHRSRDARGRKQLLAKARDETLLCGVCGFCPPLGLERRLRESFFECHHVVPLASMPGLRSTRLRDLVLLCANCHRFIHRLMVETKGWVSIKEAREQLTNLSVS